MNQLDTKTDIDIFKTILSFTPFECQQQQRLVCKAFRQWNEHRFYYRASEVRFGSKHGLLFDAYQSREVKEQEYPFLVRKRSRDTPLEILSMENNEKLTGIPLIYLSDEDISNKNNLNNNNSINENNNELNINNNMENNEKDNNNENNNGNNNRNNNMNSYNKRMEQIIDENASHCLFSIKKLFSNFTLGIVYLENIQVKLYFQLFPIQKKIDQDQQEQEKLIQNTASNSFDSFHQSFSNFHIKMDQIISYQSFILDALNKMVGCNLFRLCLEYLDTPCELDLSRKYTQMQMWEFGPIKKMNPSLDFCVHLQFGSMNIGERYFLSSRRSRDRERLSNSLFPLTNVFLSDFDNYSDYRRFYNKYYFLHSNNHNNDNNNNTGSNNNINGIHSHSNENQNNNEESMSFHISRSNSSREKRSRSKEQTRSRNEFFNAQNLEIFELETEQRRVKLLKHFSECPSWDTPRQNSLSTLLENQIESQIMKHLEIMKGVEREKLTSVEIERVLPSYLDRKQITLQEHNLDQLLNQTYHSIKIHNNENENENENLRFLRRKLEIILKTLLHYLFMEYKKNDENDEENYHHQTPKNFVINFAFLINAIHQFHKYDILDHEQWQSHGFYQRMKRYLMERLEVYKTQLKFQENNDTVGFYKSVCQKISQMNTTHYLLKEFNMILVDLWRVKRSQSFDGIELDPDIQYGVYELKAYIQDKEISQIGEYIPGRKKQRIEY